MALVYFASGRLGLAIPYIDAHVALVWLPTGIAVAALLRWGYRCWPGIFLGSLATNFSVDLSPLLDTGIALGDTLAPLLASCLLRRMGFHSVLDRAYDILSLVVAAALGMLLSASGGVSSLLFAGALNVQDASMAWLTWWAGDFVGVLLAAPLLLNISRDELKKLWGLRVEFLAWCSIMFAMCWEVFYFNNDGHGHSLPLIFILLPVAVWSAMRFGVVGSSLGMLLPVSIATWATENGLGPFHTADPRHGLLLLWLFYFSLALTDLLAVVLQAGRNKFETELRQSEEQLRAIIEAEPECVKLVAQDGTVLQMNPAGLRMLEADTAGQIVGQKALGVVVPEHRQAFVKLMQRVFAGESGHLEFEVIGVKGSRRWLETFEVPMRDAQGRVNAMLGVTRDITEHKANEARIRRMADLYAALSQCNQAIVRCTSKEELFPQICRDAVEFGGMKMAWIGLLDDTMVRPSAAYGEGKEYLEGIEISTSADQPAGRGPIGTSVRENRPIWCQDFKNDPLTEPWREQGTLHGWGALASLPLHRKGKIIGSFALYAGETNAFDEAARNLLLEMAMDIDFALDNYALQAERNQAEAALREREADLAQFKSTLDYSLDGVFIFQPDTLRFVYVNQGAMRQVGYREDELLRMTALDIKPGFTEQGFRALLQPLMDGSSVASTFEASHRHKNGHEVPVEIVLQLVRRGVRKPRFIAFARDLTERKQIQQEAEALVRRHQAMMKSTFDGLHIMDIQGNIVEANDSFCHMLGYTQEEMSRLNVADWDGQWSKEKLLERFRHLVRSGGTLFETKHRRKDGTLIDVEISTTGAEIEGQHYLFASSRDITARKQAEEALRIAAITFETQEAILITDANANILRVNQAFQDITGYRPEEVIGHNPRMLQSGRHDAAFYQTMWAKLRDTGKWSGGIWDKRKNGEIYPKTMTITAVYDDQHRVTHYVAVFLDITERQRSLEQLSNTADELVKANTKLEEERSTLAQRVEERTAQLRYANRAKDSFLATMSHEIRTPLGGLLGMMELLDLSRLSPDQRELLGAARNSGNSLLRIVNDILDWSKIEAGKLELAPRAATLSGLLKSVVGTYAQLASEKNLQLELEVDPALGAIHLFDPLRLSQILNNFTSNAIKFTARGTVRLRAQRLAHRAGYDTVCFSVQDSGMGIDQEQQARLFQHYQQASADTARMYGGTGLGLAICRSLAELMGGTLGVESSAGIGSTFSFIVELPIANVALPADPGQQHASAPEPDITPLGGAGQPLALLIVDDHPLNRMLLKQQLALLGLQADAAADGAEAMSLWQSQHFDLIITDCHMPEMDGYELTRNIRAIEQHTGSKRIPIIAWTANVLAEEEQRCRAAGMDDLLTKPTELAELRAKLLNWLVKAGVIPLPPRNPQPSAATLPSTGAAPDVAALDVAVLANISTRHAAQAEMLQEFNVYNRSDVAKLQAALQAGDPAAVAQGAHRIKGACRMVGALELEGICARIEQAAKQDDIPGARATAEHTLEGAMARVEEAISKFIGGQ